MIPPVPDNSGSPGPHRNDRLVALFLLGAVAFSPPLLQVFSAPTTLFGWPLLFIYIFVVWLLIVALIAIDVEFRDSITFRRSDRGAGD